MATAYGQALVVGLGVADVQDWPRRIQSVTAQDVRNAAAAGALVRREAVTLYLTPGPAMRKLALAALFALCAAVPAAASAPRALDIGPGEQVWFEEDHTVPMVAVSIALPAGSVYDPTSKPGLAAFAAYMLNEGAGDIRSEAFQAELANRAIQLAMSPDRDWLILSLDHAVGAGEGRVPADRAGAAAAALRRRRRRAGARPDAAKPAAGRADPASSRPTASTRSISAAIPTPINDRRRRRRA